MIKNILFKSLPFVLIILGCIACRNDQAELQNNSDTNSAPVIVAAEKTPAKKWTLDKNDPRRVAGNVTHISDGDTFIIEKDGGEKVTVRIHAIDAPELAQEFGKESRESLRALIANQTVEIRRQKTDQYKRIVGAVFLDGKDIGLEQIKLGHAWVYRQFLKEIPAGDRTLYQDAEVRAEDSRIGLWSVTRPVAPWDYRKANGTRR